MKRRKFCQLVSLTPLSGVLLSCDGGAGPTPAGSQAAGAQAEGAPDWVRSLKDSDMVGLGPDGKPDPNYNANGTGHARTDVDPTKPFEMTLTQEEQDILDGKEGDAKAKVPQDNRPLFRL